MDLRALKYFVSVYDSGSFSAASKRLFIAQPSISAAIKQLEQSLSQTLFVREPRGVKPTQAGESLYPMAQQLLGQANAIQDLFADTPHKQPFRLGLVKGLGVARMSDLLGQFTTRVEQLELTLVPAEEQCDARIISQDLLSSAETFVPMWQEDYLMAIPHHHPLSLTEQISLRDLEGLPMIERSPCEGWRLLRDRWQQQGITPDIRARIQTVEYAIGLVKAGLGCAFIPVPPQTVRQGEIQFKRLEDLQLSRQIGLAFRQPSEVVRTLQDIVASA